MANFKERFKELRQAKGISQREIGLHLGYSESTISLYESGEREPKRIEDIIKIANYFDVSADYLFGSIDIKKGYITEHDIDGHFIKIGVDIDHFPEGITAEQISEYFKLAQAVISLGITNVDINLMLRLKDYGFTFDDLEDFKKFKEANINDDDLDLIKIMKKHLRNK